MPTERKEGIDGAKHETTTAAVLFLVKYSTGASARGSPEL